MAEEAKKEPVKEEELDPRTRAQVRKDLHKQKTEERKRADEQLRAEYAKVKDTPAIADIISKGKEFAAWHLKIAKDGMGTRVAGQDDKGKDILETYYLTSEQRIAELDQCKGIEQFVGYIERKLP